MLVTWLKTGALAGAITLAAGTAFAQSAGQTPPGQTPTGQTPTGQTPTGSSGAPATMGGQDRDTRSGDQSGSPSKKFVQHMLLANMAEIQLGQMAAQHAASDDVKAFAQQMVTDHTKANEELKPIAQQLGVQEPTQLDSKHQKLADKLAKAQGADFDRQYMEAMVDGHKNVVKETKKAAGGSGEPGAATAGTSGQSGDSPSSTATTPPSSAGTAGTSGTTANASKTTSAEDQAVSQFAAKTLPTVQQHLEHAQTIEQTLSKKSK